jgi:hypothetical protein
MNGGKLSKKSSTNEVGAFLKKIAAAPVVKPTGQRGRLLFALDATASREPTWASACRIQSEMFAATSQLGGLEIQLCYYRGYAEFDASPWLQHPTELVKRMTAVRCLGGYTQIAKVLQHARDEARTRRVNAVVFVGDCMEEDPDSLCHLAGQLGVLAVPVFLFQEGRDPIAERTFRQITRLSRGAFCHFDRSSPQQLRDLLHAVAVYASGGQAALDDYSRRHGGIALQLTHQLTRD